MGVVTCGVLGLAVLDPMKRRQPLRRLLFWAALIMLLGFSQCLPWGGRRINAWQYGLGCCMVSFALFPLSAMANDIVAAAIVKIYSEDGELMWLELFWGLTRIPARALGPLLLVYGLDVDRTGGICYVSLAVLATLAIITLFVLRASLITPGPPASCSCILFV
jgi:hypothetical protein